MAGKTTYRPLVSKIGKTSSYYYLPYVTSCIASHEHPVEVFLLQRQGPSPRLPCASRPRSWQERDEAPPSGRTVFIWYKRRRGCYIDTRLGGGAGVDMAELPEFLDLAELDRARRVHIADITNLSNLR